MKCAATIWRGLYTNELEQVLDTAESFQSIAVLTSSRVFRRLDPTKQVTVEAQTKKFKPVIIAFVSFLFFLRRFNCSFPKCDYPRYLCTSNSLQAKKKVATLGLGSFSCLD